MNDNRLNYILFLVLSLAIIVGYSMYFGKPPKKAPQEPATKGDLVEETLPSPIPTDDPVAELNIEEKPYSTEPNGKSVTIETPLYKGVIDTSGARIISWELRDYQQTTSKDSPIVNLFKDSPPSFYTILRLHEIDVPQIIPYKYEGISHIDLSEGTKEMVFHWEGSEGVSIKKIYEFDSATYSVKQRFEVTNNLERDLPERLHISWYGKIENLGRGGDTKKFITLVSGEVEKLDKVPEKETLYKGDIDWFGYTGKYFITSMLPEIGGETSIKVVPQSEGDIVRAVYSYPQSTIPAGKTSTRNWEAYLGPLEYNYLKPLGSGMEEAVDYGYLGVLAKPMLDFLKFLNSYIHNYGLSIIAITIIIRVLFLPLTVKSMVSMKESAMKMEKLKPKMDELKEKYKDDKAKQNAELMKLYTSSGVNPLSTLGGCLPMLVQLPVFIALYDVLLHSIDLRHSSFLWVKDLAEPETLFDIPGIGIPFRILPLLMGVSWYVSQKMTPMTMTPGNEQMQLQMKMMQFMPIIFTVLFWGLPSGLIIYWTVSNILSIGQQIYVNRRIKKSTGG